MKQALLTRKKLNESAIRHNRLHLGFVNITHRWHSHDSLDPGNSPVYSIFIGTEDAYFAHFIFLFQVNGGAGLALDLLYHFTAWPDHRTDKFLIDKEFNHSWCV